MKVQVKLVDTENQNGIHYYTARNCNNNFIIAPHNSENSNSLELLKFRLWAERQNRGITCVGVLNQLPLFSQFADRMILRDKPDVLRESYTSIFSFYGIDPSVPAGEPGDPLDVAIPPQIANDIKTYPELMRTVVESISDDEVIERYQSPSVLIRRSTWELFHSLDLPSNIVMCEIKPYFDGPAMRDAIERNRSLFRYPIHGLHWEHQQKLTEQAGQHYMGIQVLASLLRNWTYVCYGGSSNLFSLLPVKVALLSDTHCVPHYPLVRKLAVARWGDLGSRVPTIGYPMLEDVEAFAKAVNELSREQIEWEIENPGSGEPGSVWKSKSRGCGC
jgi:hypothetical protein